MGENNRIIWGLEPQYDAGRMIQIYEAIKDLNVGSILDIACGTGIIADGLGWVMEAKIEQYDVKEYPEWEHLRVIPKIMSVDDLMDTDKKYDLVLFLNSFRTYDKQTEFWEWLKGHAKYLITSGLDEKGDEIGMDAKGHKLEIYRL